MSKKFQDLKREEILSDMRKTIGTQEPIFFFEKMVDIFDLLFDRIDELQIEAKKTSLKATLAIQWEPKLASTMLSLMIDDLREDKETYFDEISQLKKAYVEDRVTQNYNDFCVFWEDTLGWHPFLEYK
jgi:hypothetical protein